MKEKDRIAAIEIDISELKLLIEKLTVNTMKFEMELLEFKNMVNEYIQENKVIIKEMREDRKKFEEKITEYVQVNKASIERMEEDTRRFKEEMKEFKNQVSEYIQTSKANMKETEKDRKKFEEKITEYVRVNKASIERMEEDTRKFKEKVRDYIEWSKEIIDDMRKQWGNLANKMGTLVEDIFSPSFGEAIKKHFGYYPDVIDTNKLIRKEGKEIEIDIFAVKRDKKEIFILEVKSNPDREDYINNFERKIKKLEWFMPEIKKYKIIKIYAGLNMKKETIEKLTKRGIYAMIVKGDILEIVNIKDIDMVGENK